MSLGGRRWIPCEGRKSRLELLTSSEDTGSPPTPFSLQYPYNQYSYCRSKTAPHRPRTWYYCTIYVNQPDNRTLLAARRGYRNTYVSIMNTDTESHTAGREPASAAAQSIHLMFRTFTVSPNTDPGSIGSPGGCSGSPTTQIVWGYGFVVTRSPDWTADSSQTRDLKRWIPSQSELSEDKYRHWRPTSDLVRRRGVKKRISGLMLPIMSVRSLLYVDWDLTSRLEIHPDNVDTSFQEVSGER